MLDIVLLVGGPLALVGSVLLAWAAAFWLGRFKTLRLLAFAAAVVMVPPGIYLSAYRYRGPGESRNVQLHPGISYERRVVDGPNVLHIVRIDLSRDDLAIVGTPATPDGVVPAQKVSDFAQEHHALVAINAAFFAPFHSNSPLDYYPHSGDPVSPFGITMSEGVEFGANRYHRATVYFNDAGEVSLDPLADATVAASGRTVLVRDGVANPSSPQGAHAPRSVVGFDGTRVLFVVADGRQPGYSEGPTLRRMAELLVELGAVWAVEMDGGGSTSLVDGTQDTPRPLNCPIHTRLPCRERAVAGQLGVTARTR